MATKEGLVNGPTRLNSMDPHLKFLRVSNEMGTGRQITFSKRCPLGCAPRLEFQGSKEAGWFDCRS
jgi:hypothetical protein